MTIYIDSAVKSEIESVEKYSFVKGLTCNPALIASAMKRNEVKTQEIIDLVKWILENFPGVIFIQTNYTDYQGICKEAAHLSFLAPKRIVVKIPYSVDGLKAVARLKEENISTAVTSIFDPLQVYASAEAGADYAIPYYNRMKREGIDVSAVIPDMLNICRNYGGNISLLAASVKTREEILELLKLGVFNITIPLALIEQIMENELTKKSIEKFQEALKVKDL